MQGCLFRPAVQTSFEILQNMYRAGSVLHCTHTAVLSCIVCEVHHGYRGFCARKPRPGKRTCIHRVPSAKDGFPP
jgi:hypothetical protein